MRRPRRSLAWWLLMSHLAVGAAAVVALLLTGVLDRDLRWQTASALEAQAHAWALSLGHAAEVSNRTLSVVAAEHEPQLTEARQRTLAGLQVVDRGANVVASATPARDTWLGDAPEVQAALAGEIGTYARPRPTQWHQREVSLHGPSRFGDVRLFVAVPVVHHGEVVGAVVASRTPRAQVQALLQIGSPLAWRVGAIAFFASLVALTAGHFGSRSFRRLARAARLIAGGAAPQQQLCGLQRSRVAEVGAVARAVETMGCRLRRRMDGARAFAGNAAHEFRTPIATLRGTLELMRDDPSMPSAQRERFLDNGIEELRRLDSLVGGLLDIGRAERLTTADSVDLDILLRAMARTHGSVLTGSAGIVVGNRAALQQVAENLLRNAEQHGGPDVHLHAWRTDTEAGFDVIDDGPGIDPKTEAQLFDRFFTTDRAHGVGLGLSVVRSLVRAHGGEIRSECKAGRTRLSVSLAIAGGADRTVERTIRQASAAEVL